MTAWSNHGARRSSVSRFALLLTLMGASTVSMMASTIYVPSIPEIAEAFGASIAAVQCTFVGYLAAFACGTLVLGPLSDRFGRRPVMLLGLGLGMAASLACTASPTIGFLIAARAAQGFGACAGMAVGRAILRDLYGREGAAKLLAGLLFAMTAAQAGAPILGGRLQSWFGWRADFAAVALLAAASLALAAWFVPETRQWGTVSPGRPAVPQGAGDSYRILLGSRRFLGYALAAAGAHAGFHIFTAGAPVVLIGTLGIAALDYGFYAALPPAGFLVGSFLSTRLATRLGVDTLITLGCLILLPAGVAMVALTLVPAAGPFGIVGPMIAISCASGLVTPNAAAGGISVFPRIAGAASGLSGFMQIAAAAGGTAALALLDSSDPMMLALAIAGVGAVAATAFATLCRGSAIPADQAVRAA
jgi:DHA1 family bicyclomycin/chloramphenicol resistance-like MFS transporter